MLDMVFQLITFFMLVINFRAASIDPSINLPKIGTARPVAASGESDVLVLNVAATGELNVYGHRQEAQPFIEREAQASLVKAQQQNEKLKPGDELPTTVVIRADKATEFTKVNRVLMACQRVGFRKVSLKVLDTQVVKGSQDTH
jgi:biopolymer transport protein ExbD